LNICIPILIIIHSSLLLFMISTVLCLIKLQIKCNYLSNQCLSPLMSWVRISIRARGTKLCDKVCQWLVTSQWFSPVSSTNKTERHNITETLLKVALNTIKETKQRTIEILPSGVLPLTVLYSIYLCLYYTYSPVFSTKCKI